MMHRGRLFVITVALILWISTGAVRAQLTTADVYGTVTDTSASLLANATVTIENLATHETRTAQTNSSGQYVFTLLLPGHYTITIQAPGFKAFKIDDVAVVGGDHAREDAQLQVGKTSDTVVVTAQTPLLQADNATVSNTITEQATQSLPTATRNLTTLIQLSTGANEASSVNGLSSGSRPDDRRQTSAFSVNGQDVELNNEQIDGTDNNERIIGTIGVKPSLDAIEEVTVQTNNYTAESGRTAGGVISVITKDGTNNFHGSLYEFLENNAFNARNPFNPKPNPDTPISPQSELRQNDFGGSFGGPIIRNRTFFFGGYEGFRQIAGVQNPIFSTVPTAAAQALGPQGIVNADPTTAGLSVDPIAANLFKLYPLPNTGGPGALTNNFLYDPNQTQYSTTIDARVDHQFSPNNLFYARYTSNNVSTVIPSALPSVNVNGLVINPGNGQFGFSGPAKDIAYNGQLNFTHIFTPQVLLELKAAYTRIDNSSEAPNSGTNAATAIGFPGNINYSPQASALTFISVPNFAPLGDSNYLPIEDLSNTFEYNGTVTVTHGRHTIKAGALLIRRQARNLQSSNPVGNISFGLPEDNGPTPQDYNNNLATFLVGAFTSEGRSNNLFTPDYRSWEPGFYAQDTWRVNAALTLNYGARYDVFTPFTEAHGHISNFDPVTNQILVPSSSFKTLAAQGIDTSGMVPSSSTAGVQTDYSNFQPRVGFAATVAKGTVVRGGFGMAFFPGNYTAIASLKNAPFTSQYAPGCQSPLATQLENIDIGNGKPGISPSQQSPQCSTANGQTTTLGGPTGGLPIPVAQTLHSPNLSLANNTSLHFRAGSILQFNLLVEKEFGQNVVTIGYVGSLGRHLPADINDINLPNPSTATPGSLLTLRPLRNVLPNLTSVAEDLSIGSSSYNSLQTSFQRRYANGLTVLANYTYSHSLDNVVDLSDEGQEGFGNANPFDLSYEYGNSDLDLRHRFVAASTYELPFGKDAHGLTRAAIGGWQANSILVWNSGNPFTITDNFTGTPNSVYGGGLSPGPTRPNQIAKATLSRPSINEWFNPNAFVIPELGTLGSARRNSLYGPRFRHIDLSLFKSFDITEKTKLQFRAEAFDLTNTPSYFVANNQNDDATTNLPPAAGQEPSSAFAKIVRMNPNYTPRTLQLALKLTF